MAETDALKLSGAGLPGVIATMPSELRAKAEVRQRMLGARLAIGRYVIVGELGRGGMGVVYDAWDPRIERRVAIKTVEPDLVADEEEREEIIERFRREIRIVGRLHHPSIVTVFDYGEEPELRPGQDPYERGRIYYYVMEYLEGESLAKRMRDRGILSDDEAVGIAIDIASALAVAHAKGVIHRDIKPSNIFLRAPSDRAVLLDFGIAKTASPPLTRAGQILGTPTYLAPERLKEKEIPLDGRADLFSLGVLLYTMLAGEAPFAGADVYDLLDKIQKSSHPKLSRSTPAGVALSNTLDRLLAKNREERIQTAGEVVDRLTEVRAMLVRTGAQVADLGPDVVRLSDPAATLEVRRHEQRDESTGAEDERLRPRGLRGPEEARVPIGAREMSDTALDPSPETARRTRRLSLPDLEALVSPEIEAGLDEIPSGEFDLVQSPSQMARAGAPRAALHVGGAAADPSGPLLVPSADADDPSDDPMGATHPGGPPAPRPAPVPPRRASSSEEETVAEPDGLAGLLPVGLRPSDAKVIPVPLGSDESAEVRTVSEDKNRIVIRAAMNDRETSIAEAVRPRRSRIEASLVDEDEVVVRPAPRVPAEDAPTASAVKVEPKKDPSGGLPVAKRDKPAEPSPTLEDAPPVDESTSDSMEFEGPLAHLIKKDQAAETDHVRPRRPKDLGSGLELDAETRPERAALKVKDPAPTRPKESPSRAPAAPPPKPSAAVARQTVGSPPKPPEKKGLAEPPVEIRVSGTDLDRAFDTRRGLRRLLAILVVAAFSSVAFGLFLARRRAVPPAAETQTPPPARPVEPRAGLPPTAPVAPKETAVLEAAALLTDADQALADRRFQEADRLYARAIETARDREPRVLVRATLGRARTADRAGYPKVAREHYRRLLQLPATEAELAEARAYLDAPDGAKVEPKPEPRRAAKAPAKVVAPAKAPAPAKVAPPPPAKADTGLDLVALQAMKPSERCAVALKRYLSDPAGGIKAFKVLVAKDPTLGCGFRNLGRFYHRQGYRELAADAYRRYLELEPSANDRGSIEEVLRQLAKE